MVHKLVASQCPWVMAKSMPASLRGEWCAAGLGKFKFSRGLVRAKSQSILIDDKLQLYHNFTRNGDAPLAAIWLQKFASGQQVVSK